MKKIFIILLVSYPVIASSQNVGIGTTSPSEKLEVKNPLRSTIKIRSAFYTDTTQLILSNRDAFNQGTDFSIKSTREEGLFISSLSDLPENASDNSLVIKPNGRIGIKTASPVYALDVTGDINTSGSLRINGNPGTTGQVLTSNGAADPVWQTMLSNYPIDGRIMIPVSNTSIPSQISVNLNLGTPVYNTFGPNISVGTNSVTINVTGLYELEGNLSFETGLVSIPTTYASGNPYASFRILVDYGLTSASFLQILQRLDLFSPSSTSSNLYMESIPFRMVTRIPGGTILNFSANIFQYSVDICCDAPPRVNEGYISINRIN